MKLLKNYCNTLIVIALAIAMIVPSSTVFAKQVQQQATSYTTVTEIEDWGAVITKVIVYLGKPVAKDSITKDTFSVEVARSDDRLTIPLIESGYRTVTKAYVSDKEGNPVVRGKYATLELEIGPSITLSSALNYYNEQNEWIDCNYTITQVKDISFGSETITGIVANVFAGNTRVLVDDFSLASGNYDNITLNYAYYEPTKDKGKNPLIIWLHGGGEGGTDATIPISANKAVIFASDETQSYFGGAYVLAPQSPTYWMEGISGTADGTSIYTEAIMELIKDYVSKNSDIDQNRIYIGGCSNGGYMTMVMIRDYPGYFAAAYPVCGAIDDSLTTDADVQNMIKTPIWMTLSKKDPYFVISVPQCYNRLVEAGAKNIYLTLFDNVVDQSGLYLNADGSPYEYNGHWSWIYVYNNECKTTINGNTTTIMEWMASQSLSK